MTKFKIEAFAGAVMLMIGVIAGHAMSGTVVTREPTPAATSIATYDMMIAARNLPVQAIDSLY